MVLTRRTLISGGAAVAAVTVLPWPAAAEGKAAAESKAAVASDSVVLARAAGPIVLAARETHLVLAPVPAPRGRKARPKPKANKAKGAKPEPPRTLVVLRDVVVREGAPVYDVFLVLEGPNVFQATTTRLQVGALELLDGSGGSRGGAEPVIAFDASDAFAKFGRIRGFNIRRLRVVIARRAVADKETSKDTVPQDRHPPEIGAVELVRS